MKPPRSSVLLEHRNHTTGFSLVELSVAMLILSLLLVLVLEIISNLVGVSSYAKNQVFGSQQARLASESMIRRISLATLNNYYDYVNADGLYRTSQNAATFSPRDYRLASDLHFIVLPASVALNQDAAFCPGSAVFFQAELGYSMAADLRASKGLLNESGFFVEYSNQSGRPSFLNGVLPPEPYRYRLVEVLDPSELLTVYRSTKPDGTDSSRIGYDRVWMQDLLQGKRHVVAQNVVLLLALPKVSPSDEQRLSGKVDGSFLAPGFQYDSRAWEKPSSPGPLVEYTRNQLPPIIEVVVVTITDASAARLGGGSTPPLGDVFVGLFQEPAVLNRTPGDEGDLARMETRLTARKVEYRVTRFDIGVQASKWSY